MLWVWETKIDEAAKQKSPRKRLRSSRPRGAIRVSPRTSFRRSRIPRSPRPVRSKLVDLLSAALQLLRVGAGLQPGQPSETQSDPQLRGKRDPYRSSRSKEI